MAIYEGVIELLGKGIEKYKRSGGGWSERSVFDIGEHHIRNVKIPDYIENYLVPGEEARVLISSGFTGKVIEAVESRGRKHKLSMGTVLRMVVGKSLLVCLVLFGVSIFFKKMHLLLLLIALAFVTYQGKKFLAYLKF